MQQTQNTTPTPPAPRPDGSRADRDAADHRPPSSVDSVLESIGKAVTEPIRDASDEEPAVSGTEHRKGG